MTIPPSMWSKLWKPKYPLHFWLRNTLG